MNTLQVFLWVLVTPFMSGYGDIRYLFKRKNDFVDIPCVSQESGGAAPYAVSLKRKVVQSYQVVYLYKEYEATIHEDYQSRIRVVDGLQNHKVGLNITQLHGRDTDLYHCEFSYSDHPIDRIVPGKDEFFLYVDDAYETLCSCPNHQVLIYAISAAAALLLAMFLCLAFALWCKANNHRGRTTTAPIYEEMVGVRPSNGKGTMCHLDPACREDADTSVYVGQQRENPYANPGKDLSQFTESHRYTPA